MFKVEVSKKITPFFKEAIFSLYKKESSNSANLNFLIG